MVERCVSMEPREVKRLRQIEADYKALQKAMLEWHEALRKAVLEWHEAEEWFNNACDSRDPDEAGRASDARHAARERMIALAKGSQQSNTGEPSEP